MYQKAKSKVYEVLEITNRNDIISRVDNIIISILIILNIFAVILESVSDIYKNYRLLFDILNTISIIVFTIEYLLRVWSCTSSPRFSQPIIGRLKYIISPLAVIDLIAIIPLYAPLFLPDLRALRIFRLLRILLLLKLIRYSNSIKIIGQVLKTKKEELISIIFILIVLLVFTSSLMYYIEHTAQPDKFSSIPQAMWWGIVTLTTVGYGDIYPITPIGKILSAVIAIIGVGVFALPAGLFASGFSAELHKNDKDESIICPHCGMKVSGNKSKK